MGYYKVDTALDVQAHLGECPVWSVKEQALYFVDILSNVIHRYHPVDGKHSSIVLKENIGCFGLREQGGFIAAMRTGIYLIAKDGTVERKVADNPTGGENSRFNDGRVDPWGRFWCGTVWEVDEKDNSMFCYLDSNSHLHTVVEDLGIANGLAFPPNRRWFYFSDTSNHKLYRQQLDPVSGDILGDKELVKSFDKLGFNGQPDGAAFDEEGCYWSAQFADSCIVRLSPEGELLDKIKLPVKWPTMIAFGGADLKTLFITSSRENLTQEDLSEYPLAGNLFAVRVPVAGNVEPLFKG